MDPTDTLARQLDQCREWLQQADGLLITAGAGMGVDSGLPDFRGKNGFWRAYPALQGTGIGFQDIACPVTFRRNPELAWGFYGHRLNLYRATAPHDGFRILLDMAKRYAQGAFVFTSNVDGHFQLAGFAEHRVCERHGSIHHLQCIDDCSSRIWSVADWSPEIDDIACHLVSPLPQCPDCGAVARPAILMFDDAEWNTARCEVQLRRFAVWLESVQRPLVIEVGAGIDIATVRRCSEQHGWRVIRINPDRPQITSGKGVGLRMGGLDALRLLHSLG